MNKFKVKRDNIFYFKRVNKIGSNGFCLETLFLFQMTSKHLNKKELKG